ncbi:MAG TPA: hypothetical protein V6D23_26350 [Candidatus Obscuribacterales bacterium]
MSDQITPIQRDALGATTFEKVQTIEIKTPDNSAPPASSKGSGSAPCPEDGVNFSRPMKTFLMQKKSYFTAPPPPTEVKKQQRKQEELRPKDDQVPQSNPLQSAATNTLFNMMG